MTERSQCLPSSLDELIEKLVCQPRLLVSTDFDGTISALAAQPDDAVVDPVALVALRQLAELPNTFVAVISGRSLSDLHAKLPGVSGLRLVGSHGHEFDMDTIGAIGQEQGNLLERACELVAGYVERLPGSRLERKPHGVVFHYRSAAQLPAGMLGQIIREFEALGGGCLRRGSMAVDFSVVDTNKGQALSRFRGQLAPTATLFIGDDATDEDAFRVLDPCDEGVKVGQGATVANYRVESTQEAVKLLARLAERRKEWADSASSVPIDRHLFLSDLRAAALVDIHGRVTWLCVPRLDGPPLFGLLVGGPGSGYFSVGGEGPGEQRYLENSLIGETKFGELRVVDFLECDAGLPYQRAGRSDLIRIVEGRGRVELVFAPKFNFGRVQTRIVPVSGGLRVECGQHPFFLESPEVEWEISREGAHDLARSRKNLQGGGFALRLLMGTASAGDGSINSSERLSIAQKFWEGWLATLRLPKYCRDLVSRSALVLRGLTYGPTGSIAAAATTSLPEAVGGMRNWDYRYCWPRDAFMAASALLRLGAQGPAMRLLDWLLGVVLDSQEAFFLAPIYTVNGRNVPNEAEVPEAFGYRGSRPVRIGNLAAEQLQLDTLAPIAELMRNLARKGASLTAEHLQLTDRLVELVEGRWQDPDSGIWEIRGEPRHFVHSKLMCWYTVKCCSEVARYLGADRGRWAALEAEIREQVEKRGYDDQLQTYICAYDYRQPDAALLWFLLSEFHPPDHPRITGTVRYVMQNLVHNGGIYRYHFDDALIGREGEFIICRAWLIESLILLERRSEAQALFDQLLSRISPLGLISEQWDANQNCALGNYPQAYSHIGLINAACALDEFVK